MRFIVIISLLLLLPFSCKKGSDVLATTNAGEITRSEFNDWLESRKIPVESVYKDRYSMSDYLRQVAVEKLTAVKAENNGFDKERIYKTIENTLYKNHLSTFFIEKKGEETTFSEKAADLSIIRIFYKKANTEEPSAEEEYKKSIVYNLLAELKAGKDFNDLAAKYSEDAASKQKGHLGIVPEQMLDDEIKNAVDSLKDNEYTVEPIAAGNSLCLIKLHKRYTLTEKNIRKIVTDKGNAEKIIDLYKKKSLDEILNRILKQRSIVSNINTALFTGRDEIIFSIDGESFTLYELNEILKLFYSLKNGMPSIERFQVNEKRITSEKIFKERLFASEAIKNGMDNDPLFKRNWLYLKRAALSGSFKYDILMKKIAVKDEDVRKEYLQNKTSRYYKIEKHNNKETKVILSYNDVKTSIRNKLYREKLKSFKKQWDNEILSEGNYRVEDKDFSVN